MPKIKTSFFCQNCGAQSAKWQGKCPSCGEWNTFVEEVIQREESKRGYRMPDTATRKPVRITDVTVDTHKRLNLHDQELNRVLGGGLVPGSVVLIGGEPGIGKSTLM
ncbi:MAG: DNA repair protein RadA, partial [Bacteroidia bacterium]|nr:DNA repair protein RadA [Bacteroidia bacterium]